MVVNRMVWYVFAIVAVEAMFAIPKVNWELATGQGQGGRVLACAFAILATLFAWRFRRSIALRLRGLGERLAALGDFSWLCICAIVGILLRLGWMIAYPAPQRSDYGTYFNLARGLAVSQQYGSSGSDLAFWPPGYPFFLSLFLRLFGVHGWVPEFANIVIFLITLTVVQRLAVRIGGAPVGRLATLVLVLWPTYFMCGSLASKELLVVCLLPLSFLAYVNSAEGTRPNARIAWALLTGALLGFTGLTQPSLLLLPGVLIGYDWLRKERMLWSLARIACVALAMFLVILPWMLRNHQVLGAWIPVSTNGGDVFYRANNDQATGAYAEAPIRKFVDLDEVNRSRLGYQLGIDWIRNNPDRFLLLAVRKQVLFLGDDSTGAYETLKRGLGIGGMRYAIWKGISNLYWLCIWMIMFAAFAIHAKGELSSKPEVSMVMLAVLYLYSIHSVFESGGKYHVPLIALFAIIAALAAAPCNEHARPND